MKTKCSICGREIKGFKVHWLIAHFGYKNISNVCKECDLSLFEQWFLLAEEQEE